MRIEDQNSTLAFPIFADDSTAIGTGKTGLTITATLAKNGGTASSVSPTITEIGNGLYWVTPIAAHRNTLGFNVWQFSATGAVIAPVIERVRVAPVVAGDAMALTAGERTTFAGVLEAAMLNEADGQALLAGMQAQLQAIFNDAGDVPVATLVNLIVSGVWSNATRTLTSIGNVTVAGYAAGQDPATLLSATVGKVNAIDGLLTALTEVVSAVTRFKASALSEAPSAGGGSGDAEQATLLDVQEKVDSIAVAFAGGSPVESTGATETVMARLTRIEAATGSILGGRVLRSAGPVTPAGDISLVVGSDYVENIDGSLLRTFSDPGASVHAKLTAGALSELVFSAAEKPSDPATKRIAGTITEVSEADGVTSVRIEILRTAIPVGPYSSDWKYHIWREADDLVSPPLLEGCLTLEWRA